MIMMTSTMARGEVTKSISGKCILHNALRFAQWIKIMVAKSTDIARVNAPKVANLKSVPYCVPIVANPLI